MTHTSPTTDELIEKILAHIARFGPNRAPTPIACSYEKGRWWVWIDVRNTRIWDMETNANTLISALSTAAFITCRDVK